MSILSKYLNTRSKKVVCGIAVTAIVGIGGIGVYIHNSFKAELLKLKNDIVTIEYGQTVSTNPADYLDMKSLDSDDQEKILKDAKITSKITNEEQKDYPSVGEYKLDISYEDESKIVKVIVKDTTAPVINVPDSIEIVQGTSLEKYDFKSLVYATDLAKLNDYVIDVSMIDTNNPAEYMGKVSVDDVNGNKTEKEFKVVIKSAPKSDEEAVQETVKNPDGTTSVKTTIKKKPTDSNKSSTTSGSNSGNSSSNSSNSNKTNENSSSSGRTEINTNKTGETDLGDGGTGESYEGFEWPSDWD